MRKIIPEKFYDEAWDEWKLMVESFKSVRGKERKNLELELFHSPEPWVLELGLNDEGVIEYISRSAKKRYEEDQSRQKAMSREYAEAMEQLEQEEFEHDRKIEQEAREDEEYDEMKRQERIERDIHRPDPGQYI